MSDLTQRQQALDISQSFIVQAPAGSGKTELLTQRYLKLLSVSDSPESVLAMTFTKKAVSELKKRVIDALKMASGKCPEQPHKQITYDLARAVLSQSKKHNWQLIEMPQRLKITTIDGLSNLITSRYPPPNTWINKQIITQSWQQENIYLEAAQQTLLALNTDEFGDCIGDTLLYLDNNVNRFYRLIVLMLSKRDQWLGKLYTKNALNIENLKNTATDVVCQHLEQLVEQIAIYFDKNFFNALSVNTKEEISNIGKLPITTADGITHWKILADLCLTKKGECRKTLTKTNGFPVEFKVQKQVVLDVLLELSAQTELITLLAGVQTLPDIELSIDQIQALKNIAQVLKIAVAQLNILFENTQSTDFIQVAIEANQVLIDDKSTDVALFLDYKIQHLLIDEFQDTSSTQFVLIEKLIANWQESDAKTLFLVGDPMQSIYLFRQSQVGLFLQVRESGIANLAPKFLQLSTNFRSDKIVVEANNTYFSKIFPTIENPQLGGISYSNSHANDAATQLGGVDFYPFAYKNNIQEAQQVLDIVKKNLDKTVAVLVRSRSHLTQIVPALKSANIVFEALNTTPLKNESLTQDLISLTRGLLDLSDKLAWLAILRAPWCGLLLSDILILSKPKNSIIFELINTPDMLDKLSSDGVNRVKSLFKILSIVVNHKSRFSFVQTLEFAIEQLRPQSSLNNKEQIIKSQFMTVIDECETLGQLNIKTINQQLEMLYAPSISSNIKLMTIHQSKGLEFDVVIIPDLGRVPRSNKPGIIQLHEFSNQALLLAPIKSYQAQNPSNTYHYLKQIKERQEYFESTRLLYVAMTRAKSNIHLLATLNKQNEAGKNTFLKLLEPLLRHQFNPVDSPQDDAQITSPLLIRYQTPLEAQPRIDEAHEKIDINQTIDLGYKSLLGTLIHKCFELEKFELSVDIINQRLIELGFALEGIGSISSRVIQLLKNTQQDSNFNWLFKSRSSTQVEAEFIHTPVGSEKSQSNSVIIDRFFIEDDILWIIDFKTAELLPNETTKQYIKRQRLKHIKQLTFYKEVLTNSYQGEIKCALYCPAVSQLIKL